ncbi:unnamed protein product [Ambrosiozyma monospora]|uniref:Unnamed protein product n=1 Tax=Ambrosiozyma monospora TaxID=43982 RepID=A0ACB5TX95_AMBMO|nr:unnamed protein product [Ambrosiozyma monospora]
MTSIKPVQATDLFETNPINLDPLTENFYIYFYLQYLTDWPSLFYKSTSARNTITGYMLAKTEGKSTDWHSHISAVTIDPNYRRIGLASWLCKALESYTEPEKPYHCYFVDLFVKCNNKTAITLYEKLGYSVFRRVVGYYGGPNDVPSKNKLVENEDAFDMRKPLKRDVSRKSIRMGGRKQLVFPEDVYF